MFVVPTDLQRAILCAETGRGDLLSRGLSRRYRRAPAVSARYRDDQISQSAPRAERERPIICATVNPRGDPLFIRDNAPGDRVVQIRGQAISAGEILQMRENSISDQSSLMNVL